MPFEKEPAYPLEEAEKIEEEIEKEEVEMEKAPEEGREEMGEEKPEAISEKEIPEAEEEKQKEEIAEIQREIEEFKEKELEERKVGEGKEEKERKLETTKELVRESLPEKFEDLVGDNSKEAWDKRKELAEKEPMYTAASLTGIASEKSRDWLDKNKESQKMWWGISRGLIGDDSDKAWEIRDFLKIDKRVDRVRGKRLSIMKKILGLHGSEFLFNLRKRIKFPGWYEPGDIIISTTGLDSEKSWKLREELEEIAPAETLLSLAGNDSEKAQELREKYKGDKKLSWALRRSLANVEIKKEQEQKQEQKQESKNISPEEEAFPDKEMSPEDFKEMIDQIPALKEMLQERKERLKLLMESEIKTEGVEKEIETLTTEIAELEEEISNRESLL